MKVGILSDIHGNSFALERVLDEAKILKVDELLILGDFIGYYHHPDKVLSLLSSWKYNFIRGNHETILGRFIDSDKKYRDEVRNKYGLGHDAAVEKLSKREINDLIHAPTVRNVRFEKTSIVMSHGSPEDCDRYIYPDANKLELDRMNSELVDFVFMGHTHYPFCYMGTNTHIINVGSVGQSRVAGGIANWGILNTQNGVYVPKQTSYCVKELRLELMSFENTPEYLINILLRNNIWIDQ